MVSFYNFIRHVYVHYNGNNRRNTYAIYAKTVLNSLSYKKKNRRYIWETIRYIISINVRIYDEYVQ